MNTTGAARVDDTARRGRECDCPPWYWACAHFEGRVLVLNGWSDAPRCKRCHSPSTIRIWLLYEAKATRCPDCGDWEVGKMRGSGDTTRTIADAAFREAEEALLAQDADGRAVQGEPGEETR